MSSNKWFLADPELTSRGLSQAELVNKYWKDEEERQAGLPEPEVLYSSPFTRALDTCKISFADVLSRGQKTLVVENIREHNGVNTCDKRRTRSYIEKRFPEFDIENGFTEEDELWEKDRRETEEEMEDRARKVMDLVFERPGTFVSITAHSGWARVALRVVNHDAYKLNTGGVVTMLVKQTRSGTA